MNVEWWGGEQSSPPPEYNSALRRDQAPLKGWSAVLTTRRARRSRAKEHRASLSSSAICVYLCASVVKWCFGLG